MNSEVCGVFGTKQAAVEAAEKLINSGFSQSEVKIEEYTDSSESEAENRTSLLTITAKESQSRQKAYGILAQSGAGTLKRKV
jgi:hypothetical protein